MASYTNGTVVRCVMLFYSDAAKTTLADPTTVLFRSLSPHNVVVAYTYLTHAQLVKDATGTYHVDVTTDDVGEWRYSFKGTGAVAVVEESSFVATPSVFDI